MNLDNKMSQEANLLLSLSRDFELFLRDKRLQLIPTWSLCLNYLQAALVLDP